VKRNALVFVALTVAVMAMLASGKFLDKSRKPGSMHLIGDVKGIPAPDFSLLTLDGKKVKLSDYRGKAVLLNFWATWCPPCIEELPSLNAFQRRFANSGVVVLGISVDKDEKLYRDFLAKARVSFLTARDPDNKINAEYGTLKFPETYIIDARGKVVRKIISNTDWMSERMLKDVESLL
jgi:peroxiredoxin